MTIRGHSNFEARGPSGNCTFGFRVELLLASSNLGQHRPHFGVDLGDVVSA
jgi:hypothetical protein